jgi:CheY-like chemotaxis protein
MQRMRLAGAVLIGIFAASLVAEVALLLRLRDQAHALARLDRTTVTGAATQLVLSHQALHGALLDHRLGAPDLAVRQAYEAFAQRLEQMRAIADASGLGRLPGLVPTLQSAAGLAARVDAQLESMPPDTVLPGTLELLHRSVPPLREPLGLVLQSVEAAQQLADIDVARRLAALERQAATGLMLLAAGAVAAAGVVLLGWRQLRRAGLQQARLAVRAQELRTEAEQAMRGRLDALAFVAAETNARIAGVTGGLARALDNADLDPRVREALLSLRTQSDDLLVLATDLADLARLEAGELRLRPAPFRLADSMQQAADLLRHRFRTEAVTVAVAEPTALPAWWVGDAARVRQLLHHLGSAAAELGVHGRLQLSAERLEAAAAGGADLPERLALEASIAPGPAALPREPDGSRQRVHSLSLTLVRTLSAAMGGRLTQQEDADGGCLLRVVLPLAACAAPAGAVQDPPADAIGLGSGPLDILVVDDVVLNRRLLGAVLERFGHRCEMATDGLDALRAVQQRRFDVVLMDIQMPNLDGIAATRMLRALPPPAGLVPVIAVTAAGEPEDRAAYEAAGMDGFVQKPVATDDLLAAIAALTGTQRSEPSVERDAPSEMAVGPLMDTQSLSILRSTLAADELTRLVAATEQEANAALRAGEAAVARGDGPGLAAAAQALIQACEGVGALRVVAIARAVQAAAADGSAARAAAHLPALRRALGETVAAISRRAPGSPSARPGATALAPPQPALTASQDRP